MFLFFFKQKTAYEMLRSLVGSEMCIRDSIIAGAQKSGTTSLHRLLEFHEDIFFPPHKQEIHFFDIDRNFNKGDDWYLSLIHI